MTRHSTNIGSVRREVRGSVGRKIGKTLFKPTDVINANMSTFMGKRVLGRVEQLTSSYHFTKMCQL